MAVGKPGNISRSVGKTREEAKTDAQREHAKSDIEGLSGMFNPVRETVLAFPNHGLDPAKMPIEIDLGGLTWLSRPSSANGTDLISAFPRKTSVYTGDLLTGGQYPVNINGYPTLWRATLAKFATFDKNTLFVPGHGQVCGQEGVAEMRSCFDDLAEQAEKNYKAGVQWMKPSSATWSPIASRITASSPGVSRSPAPPSSFTPSGRASMGMCSITCSTATPGCVVL